MVYNKILFNYSLKMQGVVDLQQQLTKRINNQSPTKYDLDFYKRKVNRLQNDCSSLQDDLNKARIRLRRSEDYQLKYELIMKQNNHLQNQLDKREKELCQKKSELQTIKIKIQEKGTKNDDFSKEKLQLQRQIQKWKVKAEEAQQKRIAFMLQSRDKSELNQKRQIQGLKKQFIEKEQGYQFQIRQLKKQLNQKQNIEGVISNRIQKIRSQKDQQIKRLQQFIQKQRIANEQSYRQKSEETDKLRDKFERFLNFQMQNLKKSVEDHDEIFNIQLNGFREMISIKNDQISKLLQRVRKQTQQHQRDRLQMAQQNNMYRQKIYTIQRQNELQINNLKERLTKLHSLEIQSLQKRFNSIIDGLKEEHKQLEKQIKEKDKVVEAEQRQYGRLKEEMHDRLKERDVKIDELKQKIKVTTQLNQNQIKNLHQSFHQIQSQKQLMTSEYQTNVGFLNQQLSKITVKNDSLNLTIKGLHEQIVRIKKEYTLLIQDIQVRWKQQRKEYDEERQKQKQKIEKLQDQNRQRDRMYKIKEKQLQRARQKQQRQKNKLQFIIQQMERDAQRLNNYIKQLDQNLKRQLKNNQTATLDSGGMRRQLNNELERQKSQLQAIKRMQVDHLRKKMEIQLTRLMSDNQKLQKSLLQKTLSLDSLQQQFKKLEHVNKNIDRINKEKLIQYQKKMATLNSQITITQTLYNKFLEVKARTANKK